MDVEPIPDDVIREVLRHCPLQLVTKCMLVSKVNRRLGQENIDQCLHPDTQVYLARRNKITLYTTKQTRPIHFTTSQVLAPSKEITIDSNLGEVTCLFLSPDGTQIYLTENSSQGSVWQVTHPEHTVRRMNDVFKESAMCMALSHDKTTLIIGGIDPNIQLLNVVTGKLEKSVPRVHHSWTRSMALCPDETRLVSGDYDGDLIVRSFPQMVVLHRQRKHKEKIVNVHFVDDRTFVTSSSQILVWDLDTMTTLRSITAGPSQMKITAIPAFWKGLESMRGTTRLIWALESKNVKVYSFDTCQLIYKIPSESKDSLIAMGWSPDMKTMVVSGSGVVYFLSLTKREAMVRIDGTPAPFNYGCMIVI